MDRKGLIPEGDDAAIEEILDRYAMAGPSRDLLQEWAQRYPEYKQQLTELTVQWSMLKADVSPKTDTGGAEVGAGREGRSLTDFALNLLRDRRDERAKQTGLIASPGDAVVQPMDMASPAAPTSLREAIDQQGADLDDVIENARLSFDTLAMLNLGRITFPTPEIRDRVAERLATATGLAVAVIILFLRMRPRLAAGASYASEKPEAGTVDFFDAVREDPEMTTETKRYWLAMEPPSQQ